MVKRSRLDHGVSANVICRRIDERLSLRSGCACPAVPTAPPGVELNFEFVRVVGDVAYVSGHGPIDGSAPTIIGKVGADVSVEQAYDAARATALSMLASLKARARRPRPRSRAGSRRSGSSIARRASTRCLSSSTASATSSSSCGATPGRHARSAIGVAELPFDIPVEIEAIVQL